MSDNRIVILLIEDNPGDVRLIQEMLAEGPTVTYGLKCADRLSTGLERLAKEDVHVVLLDLGLPDSQGLDTLNKVCAQAPAVPIVVLTGIDDEMLARQAVRQGAQDYLPKSDMQGKVLWRVMRYAQERKQAEVALQASEEKYRTLFEIKLDGVIVIDETMRPLLANQAAADIFGFDSVTALLGADPFYFIPPEERERAFTIVANDMLETDLRQVNEFQLLNKAGEQIWISAVGARLEYQGKPAGLVSFRDITDRKRMEEVLRQSEEKYRNLVESMTDVIYSLDTAGHVTSVNKAVTAMFGFQPEEVIGIKLAEFAAKEVLPHTIADFERVRMGEETTSETTMIDKHGESHIVEFTSTPIRKDGKTLGSQGIVRDITERRRAEATIRESEEKYRQLFELGSDALFLIEVETGRILDLNNAAIEMYGYSREEALQMKNTDFSAEPDRTREATLESEEHIPLRYHRRKDGTTFPTDISVAYYTWYGKEVCVAAIRDITERRKAEEALRVLAAQTEKTAAMSVLAGGIAHELNNPMMGILNFAQYCLKHTDRDDRRYSVLEDIVTETKRCADIVQDLLSFSHVGNEEREKAQRGSLAETIDRVVRLLAYRIGKDHVSATCHIARGIPEIWMQPDRIQEVLLNLISNALDALEDTEKKEIHVQVRRDGEFVQLAVADNGHGIAPENLDRLFDPFFTTKAAGEGAGLGLSVTRSIIDGHGGKIACHSKPGVGTTFKVLLPIERRGKEATQ